MTGAIPGDQSGADAGGDQQPESQQVENQQQQNEFKAITSQDEFNAAVAERVARERGKFKDYADLKAKATRLDEIEQANKSEMEKAIDRVTKAEAKVAEIPSQVAAALREHLIAIHKIEKDDADLFLTATEPDLLMKQVSRLTSREGVKRGGNYVPREGTSSNKNQPTDERETARQLFGD